MYLALDLEASSSSIFEEAFDAFEVTLRVLINKLGIKDISWSYIK